MYAFDFWVTLTEHPEIRDLARKAHEEGHEVHIVSAISPGLPMDNDEEYARRLKDLDVPFTAIHRVDHVPEQKVGVLQKIGATEFWDDDVKYVNAAAAAGFVAHVVRPLSDGIFYTNRCTSCGRALTKLEIIEKMSLNRSLCPCGSNEFKSTNFKWWEELLLWRSWKMYFSIRRGELLPPPSREEVRANRRSLIAQVNDMIEEIDEQTEIEADEDFTLEDVR